jgi:RHS repeat-associated protein
VLNPAENKKLGDLICRYAYDAMGRLMWKKTPINVGLTQLQRKDYYYDGVRRIQEVITRPRQIFEEMPEEGLELGTGEGNDEAPVQMRGGSPPPQEIDPEPVPPPTVNEQWTDREYIYGPGYVDEFILQIDRLGRVMYMLQDANYNVVALVDASGVLLEQYAYDPYGTVLAADNLDENPRAVNRVGFQGLFFERYDGDYTQPCIAPNVAGMYYARARFYSPALGRFLQRDPNETGLPIITALLMNGQSMSILMSGFDARGLFGDGVNLYLFAGANPVNRLDPSGMTWTLGDVLVAGAGLAAQGAIVTGQAMQILGAGYAVVGAAMYLDGATLWLTMSLFDDWNPEVMGYARAAMAQGEKHMLTGVGFMGGGWALKLMGNTVLAAAPMLVAQGDQGRVFWPLAQLQAKWKHAADFGVTVNWSEKNAAVFQGALQTHLTRCDRVVQGTYRGIQGTHYYESATKLWQFFDKAGKFISGWKLYDNQVQDLLTRGNVT